AQLAQYVQACLQFNAVALAVIEGDGFDVGIARQRPGQAGGGVLATGEEDQGAAGGGREGVGHRKGTRGKRETLPPCRTERPGLRAYETNREPRPGTSAVRDSSRTQARNF